MATIYEVNEKLYFTVQGIVKSDGEPFAALGSEIAIPVVLADDGSYKVSLNSSATDYLKLTEFLDQLKTGNEDDVDFNFVLGFFNNDDGTFYEDAGYETTIYGNSNYLYIDEDSNMIYRYDGTNYYAVGGTQPDWNQEDSTQPDYIKNKPTDLGDFANDIENYVNKDTLDSTLKTTLKDYLTTEEADDKYANKDSLTSVYKVKGSVATYDDLDTDATEKVEGYVYNVIETGTNYVYVEDVDNTGEGGWDALGTGTVDLDYDSIVKLVDDEVDSKLSDYTSNSYVEKKTGEELVALVEAETSGIYICSEDYEDFEIGVTYVLDPDLDNGYEAISGTGGSTSNVYIESTFNLSNATTDDNLTIEYYWYSNNSGYGTVTLRVDGLTYASSRELQPSSGAYNLFTIDPLSSGTHTISLAVTDSAGYTGKRWSTTIVIGSLELSSSFDEDDLLEVNTPTVIGYTVSSVTSEDITVNIEINDEIAFSGIVSSGYNEYTFTPTEVGIYSIKITATTESETSNTLSYDIVCAEEGSIYIINNNTEMLSTTEGGKATFSIRVAKVNTSSFTTTIVRTQYEDSSFEIAVEDSEVTQTYTWYNGSNIWSSTSLEPGYYLFNITITASDGVSGTTQVKYEITESSLYSVNPVTTSLACWFDATDKSNDASDKTEWEDKSGNDTAVKFYNFNYTSNGWIDNALVINSNAYAVIDLAPFGTEIASAGKTIEITFDTEDILNASAKVLFCTDGTRGIYIDTEYAHLASNSNELDLNIIQGTRTRISYVIVKTTTDDYPILGMYIYINGIMSAVQTIVSSDQFSHNGYVYLGADDTGSDTGECKIYNFRVYNRALTPTEIVTNYASDAETPEEESELCVRNQLVTTDELDDLPEMILYIVDQSTFDYLNASKDNKVNSRVEYTDPNDDSRSFVKYSKTSPQGTSSMAYPVKNYKIRLYDDSDYKTKYKYDLGNGISESTFCLKADFMDSSHVRNTQSANMYADMDMDMTPPMKENSAVRNTIYGFPIRLYLVLEDNPTEKILIGIYNFNLDCKLKNSPLNK